ncbi:PA2169 family four-helix-bundle protein [Lacisediminimonas sp.]|uniref:ferritin-like domain-containing protein n=1 Tax=Lacisediminimonas sp. TaxID=3060582 RepID=UPI0027188CD7|nr:PA2169 family four-helix-bundle protein [Lacisediminimonas sp.]MDO8299925.1 PA2169 family four-helix-bundle protein [Lacisediminimonas sp.]MDO9219370.1 PA2169 family four-helix-bundle protein [Lacisediminimonas sp.]
MDDDDIIAMLNDLIETCKDGEQGFQVCAEDISDPDMKAFLLDRARTCAQAAIELQEHVVGLGGEPETSGSVAAGLHRRWVDIKSAVTGKDDETILDECERGEDVAVKSYRGALEKDFPLALRSMVEKQYKGAVRNHDQVKALRDRVRTAKNIAR